MVKQPFTVLSPHYRGFHFMMQFIDIKQRKKLDTLCIQTKTYSTLYTLVNSGFTQLPSFGLDIPLKSSSVGESSSLDEPRMQATIPLSHPFPQEFRSIFQLDNSFITINANISKAQFLCQAHKSQGPIGLGMKRQFFSLLWFLFL